MTIYKELREGLEYSLKEKYELEENNKKLQKKYERLSNVWTLQEELKTFTKEKRELEFQKHDIEEKRSKFHLGTKANSVKPYVDSLDETIKNIIENKENLEEIIDKIDNLKSRISKIEQDYKVIYEKKDKEVPLLIENEIKIKGAIELQDQVNNMRKEKEALKNKIDELNNILEKKNNELEDMNTIKVNWSEKLDKSILETKSLKVTPEYREILTKTWELQKTYNELSKTQSKEKETLRKIEEHISKKTKELYELNKELEKNNVILQGEKEKVSILDKDKPKSREDIMHQSYELEKSKISLKEALENNKKLEAIKKDIDDIFSKKNEVSKELENSTRKLANDTKKLELINKEIADLEEIHRASIISAGLKPETPCPVCGSKEHPNPANKIDDIILEEKKNILVELQNSIENTQNKNRNTELEIKLLGKDEDKKKEDLELYIGKLKDIDIEKLEKYNESMEKEISTNNETLNKWEKQYEEAKAEIEDTKEKINTLAPSIATYKEGINKYNERMNEINDNLNTINKNIEETFEELHKHKMNLEVEDVEKELLKVKRNDKKLEELEKDIDVFRDKIKELEVKREKINNDLGEASIEKGRATEQYSEKNKNIEEKKSKINSIVGEESPHKVLEETVREKNYIIKREEELRKNMEKEKDELNKLQEMQSGKIDIIYTLESSLIKIQIELTKSLQENELSTIEMVRVHISSREKLQSLKNQIEIYDREAQKIVNNIERINKELKGEEILESEWTQLKEKRESSINEYNRVLEVLGQEKEKIKEMEKDLRESNMLREDIKALKYKADMLRDMFSLVSGNKFVEFVAISHLKYIAKEASKRLMDITNNRYSLELDNSGNFIICDNFNGGVRRDCNTLSGGETFVASLSLALSLSTQIQLKGKTAFEFFFLDEGFGTLDSHLLDTVMNSLERLHEEKLSVGIISHVEELKNRIPLKLIITPSEAGLHGTKVNLESS